MRTRRTRWRMVLALTAGLACAAAHAQQEDASTRRSADTEEAELPEHRVRPLPADTFKPSEDISEDFAVPFPVDI